MTSPSSVAAPDRFLDTLRVLHVLTEEGKRPPTMRELKRAVPLSSTSVAAYHLARLNEYGLVESLDPYSGSARSTVITNAGRRALGELVMAGRPPAPNSRDADYGGCL